MDKSKTYIEMCRRAEEIQDVWVYHPGDYGYHYRHVFLLNTVKIEKYRYVWIPRQDQLQDMVVDIPFCDFGSYSHDATYKEHIGLICDVYTFASKFGEPTSSMEQLWLAYVMKYRYNKQWNGSAWIKK